MQKLFLIDNQIKRHYCILSTKAYITLSEIQLNYNINKKELSVNQKKKRKSLNPFPSSK